MEYHCFFKPSCPYCRETLQTMELKNLKYLKYNVESNQKLKNTCSELLRNTSSARMDGTYSVPKVFIFHDGKFTLIGGNSEFQAHVRSF